MSAQALRVEIAAAALIGPGLPDWATARPILRGEAPWPAASLDIPVPLPPAQRLPAAERRRVGAPVKLALGVADQLFAQTTIPPAQTATIFTSSSGDGDTCHALSSALLEPEPVLSPTRFTNSVHNAVAGYWSIAVGAMAPASALCAHDGSFCAGLLEAVVLTLVERRPVALIAFEVPYPEPMRGARPIPTAVAVALLLQPPGAGIATDAAAGSPPLAQLGVHGPMVTVQPGAGQTAALATPLADPGLEALRTRVPAARGLPLLAALARLGDRPADRAGTQLSTTLLQLDAGAGRLLQISVGGAA